MSIEADVDPPMGSMGSMAYEPPVDNSSRPTNPPSESQSNTRSGIVLRILYDLWDVDTSDVIERCLLSLNVLLRRPFLTNGMLDTEAASRTGTILGGKKPDMWGPVWIFFTMVFAVFFSATSLQMFNQYSDQYNIALLTTIAVTQFSFTFLVPVVAWFAIQYFNLVPTLTLLQTLCLYGYSCTIWVPAVLIAGSPLGASNFVGIIASRIVRYVSITIAFLFSARFIYGNLYKVMTAQATQSVDKTKMGIVLVAGIVLHAALALTIAFS